MQRGGGHVSVGAETGVSQPRLRTAGAPGAEKARKDPSSEPHRKWPC